MKYEDDYEVPLSHHDQQQHPAAAVASQQAHPGYYEHQQAQAMYYHHHQQQQQQYQGHHPYHQEQQYQQQQQPQYNGVVAAPAYHHAMYPPPPHSGYHGGGLTPASPSPTTNSEDSGGDCVNESKQRLLHAHTVHPPPVQHTMGGEGHPGSHPSQHAYYQHYIGQRGVPVVQKRPRQTRRSKKKRDPAEPQKPVSAYALFFRDMQAGIKARNPNASFGDVSKHVAAMWDNLDPDTKTAYKRRTEQAKKEYLRQLAAYRANLVSKNGGGIEPYGAYSAAYSCFAKTGDFSTYSNHNGQMIQRHASDAAAAGQGQGGGASNGPERAPGATAPPYGSHLGVPGQTASVRIYTIYSRPVTQFLL